jgi:hypothetical protein
MNQNLEIFQKTHYKYHMGLKVITESISFWPSYKIFFTEHSACGKKNQNPFHQSSKIF